MNDGDWICNEPNCGNINFARRTSCYRCNAEKPEVDQSSKKKLGTEIGKSAAEKSRGLFNADDWQCNKCANVNWARRTTCNVCNAPKFGEVEARTGYGGGYNERGVVEYRRREGSSDDEYDEFGRKKRKPLRMEGMDKVGITEGAEFKNLLPKPQMEMKVRNRMLAPATEIKAITEKKNSNSGNQNDLLPFSARENKSLYQSACHKQNMKNMHSNKVNSIYQNRQNRKRYVSAGDKEHAGSSGYETGPKKTRKDSTDSPVFMSINPVMENMVSSTNGVTKLNGGIPSQNYKVNYTTKEKVLVAAFAITYNNCKISSDRFESLLDKPAPDFKTVFAWRQQLLQTGCLDESHPKLKSGCCNRCPKPTRVPNPEEIALVSDSEEENTKGQSQLLPQNKVIQQNLQRSESVETVVLETVGRYPQQTKVNANESEERGMHNKTHTELVNTRALSISSESRNSDSSDSDSEHDLKSKTSNRSSRPITSARHSNKNTSSEFDSSQSEEDSLHSRKISETKKVRRKFKRRNAPASVSPVPCSAPEKPASIVPNTYTQPDTVTQGFQGYSTAKPIEKSPLTTGNIYTQNLRNMNAKVPLIPTIEVDSGSTEYVPTRLGAAKNNYQDFKNNVRRNRPGFWAKGNGATLTTKRNIAPGNYTRANKQDTFQSSMLPGTQAPPDQIGGNPKNLNIPGLGGLEKSPRKNHITSYIPEFVAQNLTPMKRAISTFIPIEQPKTSIYLESNVQNKTTAVKKQNNFPSLGDTEMSATKIQTNIPGLDPISPVKSSILGLEQVQPPLPNYCAISKDNSYTSSNADFTQDDIDKSAASNQFLSFADTDQHQITIKNMPQISNKVDQIPLPERQCENTERIFAVAQEHTVNKNRSIMDIFDNNGSEGKSPDKKPLKYEKMYENEKTPHVHSTQLEWDDEDDALYGDSGSSALEINNSSLMEINKTETRNENIAMYESSPKKQTDLMNEKKEMLMGLLQDIQTNNNNEQSPRKYNDRVRDSPEFFYPIQSNSIHSKKCPNLPIPEPISQDLSAELLGLSKDINEEKSPEKCNTESSNQRTINDTHSKEIIDAKRIHVIESITIEPTTNKNHPTLLLNKIPELHLKPVTEICQQGRPETSLKDSPENILILDDSTSAEEQGASPAPETVTQPPALSAPALPTVPADLSQLLAGINANTLILALQNLQQLAQTQSLNSSFSSAQNNSEEEQNAASVVKPLDTMNLTNDDWEKESIREGSIERQLEELDGNSAATPSLCDIFEPSPIVQTVTRKLNINLKSPIDNSDTVPDENAPVIGNFISFALPKPPKLKKVKLPLKPSSKYTKRKAEGNRRRKKKKAAGSQDGAPEEEEESGDEADLAKYDLWGSEDEARTGSSSKPAGPKSHEGESSKNEDEEDKNGKVDSPGSKNSSKNSSKKSRSRSRSSSSSSSSSSTSSSDSQSSSRSGSGSPKNKFDDFDLNSERESSPRVRVARSPRPRISAPLPRRKSHDSRSSNGDSRSLDSSRDKDYARDRERRPDRARGSRSGDKERRYSRDSNSRDGNSRDGNSRDGNSRDGNSRDGNSRDGNSRDGNSRDGNSRDGNSRDGSSRDGNSRDGHYSGGRGRQR